MYALSMPAHYKHDQARTNHTLLTSPPHECLHEEAVQRPEVFEELEATLEAGGLAEVYHAHPVVQANLGQLVIPLALYIDAVKYTINDGVLGFYVYNMLTGCRWLCAVLRRSCVCRCGCKGWCSLSEIWRMLHWSFQALARQEFPAEA